MLTLTPMAQTAIRGIVDQSELPDEGGIRISNDPAAAALRIGLAAVPAEDDQVVDAAGARVFLDPQAAALLDDKTLDAAADGEGRVQFGITDRTA